MGGAPSGQLKHLLGGGAVLGTAVCVMHCLGMYGMRFGGVFDWSVGPVVASIVIAMVAATAALVLAFAVRGLAARAAASGVMAAAVCAMHYTGKIAVDQFFQRIGTPRPSVQAVRRRA